MTTDPIIEPRPAFHYASVRMNVPMQFEEHLGPAWGRLAQWLAMQGQTNFGPAIIRYNTTEMDSLLDLEVGFITQQALTPSEGITCGTLPAGTYATLTHIGPYDDDGVYLANVKIVEWAKANQIVWDTTPVDGVEVWASRVEWYLSDPATDRDPQNYRTELTFKLKS